ncbi:MAG TPA: YncE family protein [Rhodanobacteraceae bacterium]|nr:YncE family protein [Rhodanobacteraceae bacterium]
MSVARAALGAVAFVAASTVFAADARIERWNVGGPGGWDYLTADAASHRLYVPRFDRVMIVDTRDGHVVGTVPGTEGVHGVVLDRKSGKAYTSNGRGNSVTRFDVASLRVEATYPIPGRGPDAIVFDESSNEIWTFNAKTRDATVLAADGRVVATVALAGKPEFAVGDARGTIFVNDEDHATVIAIDVAAHRVRATWKLDDCEGPTGLALDAEHARLFSVCQNGHMSITDAVSGRHVATVPIGRGPDGAVFDAALGNAYSSNGRDGTVTVVHERDPDHFEVAATLDTEKSARTIALDASDHRLFLAAARFEDAGNSSEPGHRPPMVPDSFAILVVRPPVPPAPTGR